MDITTHFAGPRKEPPIPYYPIRIREKMQKDEVQPIAEITSRQALDWVVRREAGSWSRFKGAGEDFSVPGFTLR